MKAKAMAQPTCNRILLADNAGCRVAFCQTHQVAELEIGAMSLRLDVETFSNLNNIVQEAMQKIHTLHASQYAYDALLQKLSNKH